MDKRPGRLPINRHSLTGGIYRRLIAFMLAVLLLALVVSDLAWAEPAAITKAKSEVEALRARIEELSDQLDAAVEDYNYAKAQLSQTNTQVKKTQAQLKEAEKDLTEARARLTERVVQIYKQGHLSFLDTLLGAESFSDLVNRLDLLRRVSEQDSKMVKEVETYRTQVAERKAKLAQQLEEQKVLTAQAEAAKKKVQAKLAENKRLLAGKEAEIAQLEKAEAERQAKLAAAAKEAARKAALAAAAQKAKATRSSGTGSGSGGSSSGGSGSSGGTKVEVPASASGNAVVQIALKYLGVPYVWAGGDPSGFDCSGLVMYVYAQVGVSLPHSSRMQYGCGTPVSRSELQPGDLVFFGNPIHHVGIYIGDGNMIHAAGTGKDVRIGTIDRGDYYGACRIIS